MENILKKSISPYLKSYYNANFIKLEDIHIEYLDVCPTWRCNAKCPTCRGWQRESTDLTKMQAQHIANYFKNLDKIVIEGGEPTLWKPLEWFVHEISKYNHKEIVVISNGFLSDKIKKLAKSWKGIDRLKFLISLNGWGQLHDESRGVKNAYNKTMKTINYLLDIDFPFRISYVGFKENEAQIETIKQKLENKCGGVNYCIPVYTEDSRFGNIWTLPTKEETIAMSKKQNASSKYLNKLGNTIFLRAYSKNKLMPCWAGKSMLHINPYGIIRPCHLNENFEIGKVVDGGIFFNNEARKKAVNQIPKVCQYNGDRICNECYVALTVRKSIPSWIKLI